MTATQTSPRIDNRTVKKLIPGAYAGANTIGEAVEQSGLEAELVELVNLRVSQINGCAYCVQYHGGNLETMGVPAEKLRLTVVWQEAGIFTEREQAALRWAEAVTLLAVDHVPDAEWEAAKAAFSEQELAELTVAVGLINFWNRLGATFRFTPEF